MGRIVMRQRIFTLQSLQPCNLWFTGRSRGEGRGCKKKGRLEIPSKHWRSTPPKNQRKSSSKNGIHKLNNREGPTKKTYIEMYGMYIVKLMILFMLYMSRN